MSSAHLVREARLRAGLTQAELAERVGTTQSSIARWESGATRPPLETVRRIVEACGLELRIGLEPRDPDAWSQIESHLALDRTERLDQLVRTVRFIEAGREAVARSDG